MMTPQARPSAKIMGFDTHMILEAVPARHSEHRNGHQPGHHATMPEPWGRRTSCIPRLRPCVDPVHHICRELDPATNVEAVFELPSIRAAGGQHVSVWRTSLGKVNGVEGRDTLEVETCVSGDSPGTYHGDGGVAVVAMMNPRLAALADPAVSSAPASVPTSASAARTPPPSTHRRLRPRLATPRLPDRACTNCSLSLLMTAHLPGWSCRPMLRRQPARSHRPGGRSGG
jgi:hypothetical protein